MFRSDSITNISDFVPAQICWCSCDLCVCFRRVKLQEDSVRTSCPTCSSSAGGSEVPQPRFHSSPRLITHTHTHTHTHTLTWPALNLFCHTLGVCIDTLTEHLLTLSVLVALKLLVCPRLHQSAMKWRQKEFSSIQVTSCVSSLQTTNQKPWTHHFST